MTRRTGGAVLRAVRAAAAPHPTDRDLLARFAAGDQGAFEGLVKRHVGMVLGVCRRVLPTTQDAEDACQAVFLILARKAGRERWHESVANYLYATARRVAANASRATARRARREVRVMPAASPSPLDQMTGRELFAALDEELDRLPAIYREPLVLCYLEGLTRDEAAARLGVPLATLKSQLERGRLRLADALTRRGVALGAGLLAVVASGSAGACPPRLVESVLASAMGRTPATAVGELVRGATVNGPLNRIKLVVVAGLLVAGLGMAAVPTHTGPQQPVPEKPKESPAEGKAKTEPAKEAKPNERTLTGRVLDPDGKPLVGAKLFAARPEGFRELGASGADGKFAVKVPANGTTVSLFARAEGVGIDFAIIPADRLGAEVELRTVADQAIRGRVVDLQGKPVVGAAVIVSNVSAYGGSLDTFLARHKGGGAAAPSKRLEHPTGVLPAVTTDKDGRFTINGAGAERLVTLHVRGAGVADLEALVVTRKDFDPKPYNEPKPPPVGGAGGGGAMRPAVANVLHAPDVSVLAEPDKRVRGTITDADTGKPRAGARVTLDRPGRGLSAVTDAEGRYEIRGGGKSTTYVVTVEADPDTRHVAVRTQVADTAGYEPIVADLKVKKGVVITGKVIDTGTKKPVRGVVEVAILSENPFVSKYPDVNIRPPASPTNEDGAFRIVTIPGPVLLTGAADVPDPQTRYKLPVADPKYPQYFQVPKGRTPVFIGYGGTARSLGRKNFCKVFEIKGDAETIAQDVLLDPNE